MPEQPKPPAIVDIVQPPSPVFLRKLDKKSDWGNADLAPDQRVSDVVDLVFERGSYPYSVYLVKTDEDLHRVIIGMNAGRQSLSSESYFLALHRHELEAVGMDINHTPSSGITRCLFANALHHDLPASKNQLRDLCLYLFQEDRKICYISKGKTKLLIPRAEADRCLAISQSHVCQVTTCK